METFYLRTRVIYENEAMEYVLPKLKKPDNIIRRIEFK